MPLGRKALFRPWVGERYGSGRVRLLVVGESHYGHPDEDQPGFTSEVIEAWRSGEKKLRYYTKLAQLLSGCSAKGLNRSEALSEIAFYNYLQVLLEWANNGRAAAAAWKAAEAPYLQILQDLDPTHILVTSHGTYERMPAAMNERDEALGGKVLHVCEYSTPSGRAWATEVPHLSRTAVSQWIAPVMAFRNLPPIGASHAGQG